MADHKDYDALEARELREDRTVETIAQLRRELEAERARAVHPLALAFLQAVAESETQNLPPARAIAARSEWIDAGCPLQARDASARGA